MIAPLQDSFEMTLVVAVRVFLIQGTCLPVGPLGVTCACGKFFPVGVGFQIFLACVLPRVATSGHVQLHE